MGKCDTLIGFKMLGVPLSFDNKVKADKNLREFALGEYGMSRSILVLAVKITFEKEENSEWYNNRNKHKEKSLMFLDIVELEKKVPILYNLKMYNPRLVEVINLKNR